MDPLTQATEQMAPMQMLGAIWLHKLWIVHMSQLRVCVGVLYKWVPAIVRGSWCPYSIWPFVHGVRCPPPGGQQEAIWHPVQGWRRPSLSPRDVTWHLRAQQQENTNTTHVDPADFSHEVGIQTQWFPLNSRGVISKPRTIWNKTPQCKRRAQFENV